MLNRLPSQVNSKVLTGDIADQTSWIKKVLAEVNASMLSIMAAAFRSVYSSTTGLIVTPTAQQDGVVYKYTLAKCEHDRDIGSFQELKLQPSLNMPIRPGIIHSGMRLSLLTKTLTGTLGESYSYKTSP